MLDIIIINWNSGVYLKNCIASIKLYGGPFISSIIIVDNASTDNSLSGIDQVDLPVTIIRNKINRGFGAACNQGAALSMAEFLLFLNPDTRLHDNSLSVPLAFMARPGNSGIGICGIQLVDETGKVTCSCARFPSSVNFMAHAVGLNKLARFRTSGLQMIEWDHSMTREVDHVIGAFFLVRRVVYDAIGGFDELYFVYMEDLDFSLRAHQAGWRSMYLASTKAFHSGGGVSRQVRAVRLFYSLRSRLQYAFKHFSAAEAWCLLFITLTIEPWIRLIFALVKGSRYDALYTLQCYRLLLKCLSKRSSLSKLPKKLAMDL